MPNLKDEQVRTLMPIIVIVIIVNLVGWVMFPQLHILLVPVTTFVFACIGKYLKDS